MDSKKYIPVLHLCDLYHTEVTFFRELNEHGLLEVISQDNSLYVHQDTIYKVEKIIRIHKELNVNIEGMDVVLNLLEKVNNLQNDLDRVQSRLRLYEDEH